MTPQRKQQSHPLRRRRVTIGDLADALGLTKGTVSRALNDYPDIAEATRLRVRKQADAMGFRPLAQAQAIRTGRSRAIGLVLQTDIRGGQRPFLADFLEGLNATAGAEGWTVTIATATSADLIPTLDRLVDERKADGFILARTFRDDARMTFLREQGVPFVLYGRVPDPHGCGWFDILGEEAMRAAVLRLAGFGHKRIGFVNGGMEYNFAHLRLEGFLDGLKEAGLPANPALIRDGAMTAEDGAAATRALLTAPTPPTGLVFATDVAALGAYRAAEELGLTIGRDLSVISYDGIPEGRYASPPLTTFRVDSRAAGARLADLLIRRVRGEPAEGLRETACAQLQPGRSDGPAPTTQSAVRARPQNQNNQPEELPCDPQTVLPGS